MVLRFHSRLLHIRLLCRRAFASLDPHGWSLSSIVAGLPARTRARTKWHSARKTPASLLAAWLRCHPHPRCSRRGCVSALLPALTPSAQRSCFPCRPTCTYWLDLPSCMAYSCLLCAQRHQPPCGVADVRPRVLLHARRQDRSRAPHGRHLGDQRSVVCAARPACCPACSLTLIGSAPRRFAGACGQPAPAWLGLSAHMPDLFVAAALFFRHPAGAVHSA